MKRETVKIVLALPSALGAAYAIGEGYQLVALGLVGVVVLLVGPMLLAAELDVRAPDADGGREDR